MTEKPRLTLALLIASAVPLVGAVDLARTDPVPANEPIPVADFFRLPACFDPQMSPDGSHIGAKVTNGDEQSLSFYDTSTKMVDTLKPYEDEDINWFTWLGDKRIACTIEAKRHWVLGMYSADISNLSVMRALIVGWGTDFISAPIQDRTKPLVWVAIRDNVRPDDGVKVIDSGVPGEWNQNRAQSDSFHAPREQNYRHVVSSFPVPPTGVGERYLCDKEGALRFAIYGQDGVNTLYRLDGEKWIACPVDLDRIDVIGAGNTPWQLVVTVRQPGKPNTLQFMDGPTGTLGEVLLQDSEYDFNGWLQRDARTHLVIGAVYDRNGPKAVWFDTERAALHEKLRAAFPKNQFLTVISESEVGHRYVTKRYSDREPAIYDWVDTDARSAALFHPSRPWLDPKRMQPMNVLQFKTVDGRTLDAYLTLPAGASKDHPCPMVVLAHDDAYGSRATWGFSPVAQFLASRGYAVLEPNYRGNPGYDWKFPDADRWDFMKMRGDIIAATRTVLRTKLIDPARVAVMGRPADDMVTLGWAEGFGSYLALGAAEDAPDLYRCVVCIEGRYDWDRLAYDYHELEGTSTLYGWIKRRLADPKKDRDRLIAISPSRHTDLLKAPVFVAYNGSTGTLRQTQSETLISALKSSHVPVEVVKRGDFTEGMHLKEVVDWYEGIEAFLAKNLGRP